MTEINSLTIIGLKRLLRYRKCMHSDSSGELLKQRGGNLDKKKSTCQRETFRAYSRYKGDLRPTELEAILSLRHVEKADELPEPGCWSAGCE